MNPDNPNNPYIPIGPVTLPTICIGDGEIPVTEVEIKWMHGDTVVCRDTIEINCSDCGFFDPAIYCDTLGEWVLEGSITNNTPYTVGNVFISLENPAYSTYFTNFNTGLLQPGASFGPIQWHIGPPANEGDTICVVTTLHSEDHTEAHVNCCSFKTVVILPDCDTTEEPCECDPDFFKEVDKGFLCNFSMGGNTVVFTPAGDLDLDCDRVVWIFGHDNSTMTTHGNESVTHNFPGPGEYEVCMIVYRTTATGECKLKVQKQITIFPPGAPPAIYPNPTGETLYLQLRQTHPSIRIIIYDLKGMEVLDVITEGEAGEIINLPVGSFTEGLYTARILSGDDQWIRRFMKLR